MPYNKSVFLFLWERNLKGLFKSFKKHLHYQFSDSDADVETAESDESEAEDSEADHFKTEEAEIDGYEADESGAEDSDTEWESVSTLATDSDSDLHVPALQDPVVVAANPEIRLALVVVKTPADVARLEGLDTATFYPCWSERRPLAFLFLNQNYRDGRNRPGSDIDNKHLGSVLIQLGYQSICLKDLTGVQMYNAVRSIAKMQAHHTRDRILLSFSCHGLNGVLTGIDNEYIYTEEVKEVLGSEVGLHKKPKICIFTACRDIDPSVQEYNSKLCPHTQNASHHLDVVSIYSTARDHTSLRDGNMGCIFEMASHAFNTDLGTMVENVRRYLAANPIVREGKTIVLCPGYLSNATKTLYMPPIPRRET